MDSEIIFSMIQRESYGYKTYAALGIGEIQSATDPQDWYWISGYENIADWVTRGRHVEELSEKGIWQNGPEFLRLPEDEWPIRQSCQTLKIPESIKSVMTFNAAVDNLQIGIIIDIDRFSCYTKLIRVTSRVLSVFQTLTPSLKHLFDNPKTKGYQTAIEFWVKDAQPGFTLHEITSKYKRLAPQIYENVVLMVGSRMENWVEFTYDNLTVPLLPYNNRFSKLYAEHIHKISHTGISTTVAKIRLRFWIMKLAKMVKCIQFYCNHVESRD